MKQLSLNARMTLTINSVILLALTALILLQVRDSYIQPASRPSGTDRKPPTVTPTRWTRS